MLLAAKWVLPITAEPIIDGAIIIRGKTIEAVGEEKMLRKLYPKEDAIDFGQAVLMPGFINVHAHLEYSIFRGVCDDLPFVPWVMQLVEKSKKLKSADWFISAELGALEAIHSGITCLGDISRVGGGFQAMMESGLRGVVFYELFGMDDSRLNQILSEAKKETEAWRKKLKGDLLKIGISPHSVYAVSPRLFQAAGEWARKEGLSLSLHLAESPDEYQFVKYGSSMLANDFRDLVGWSKLLWQPMGVTPIKYLEQWDVFEGDVIAAHCVQVDPPDIEILRKYDVGIAHCPRSNAKLGTGIAPLPSYLNDNLRLGLGTDSLASSNTMDFFDEMRIGLLLQRGAERSVERLYAERFISIATLGGAKVLRLEDKIGSLEKGKEADVIAVDLSHSHQMPVRDPYSALVYTANQEDVIFTMVAGKILYRQGEWETLDKEAIAAKAEPVRNRLTNTNGHKF